RRAAVPRAAAPARRRKRFAHGRQMAHTDDDRSIDLERDEDAEKRHAVYEATGAVDRIDDPAMRRARIVRAEFFAEDGMSWIRGRESLPDQLLRRTVGDRHRRAIGLLLDC